MTMHVMKILDHTGHTELTWDADDKAAVSDAKGKFDDYIGRGFQAFAIDVTEEDGVTVKEKGRRITAWSDIKDAGEVMLFPQLRGG